MGSKKAKGNTLSGCCLNNGIVDGQRAPTYLRCPKSLADYWRDAWLLTVSRNNHTTKVGAGLGYARNKIEPSSRGMQDGGYSR